MFQNEYIKKYKKICKSQSRWFNLELIIQAIILKKLSDKNILTGDVCTIGDGKAHFVFGVLDNPNINAIEIATPDRDVPGIKAKACAKPMRRAIFQVSKIIFFC